MIYLYLFGTCFHFIYVFMIITNILTIGGYYGEELYVISIFQVYY